MGKRGRVRLYIEGESKDLEVAVKRVERSLNDAEDATDRYNASVSRSAVATDRARDRNYALSTSTRSVRRENASLAKQLQDVNVRFTSMRNLVSVLKWPALIAGTGYATQGLGQMSAAAVGLTGALTPLSGALVTYPALLGSFAQALGVGQLALHGIGDALGEMSDQQAAAGTSAKESAKAQEAAAEQVQQAERQVADAQKTAEDAQRDLTEARKAAREELDSLKNAAIQAAFGEERAVLSLREAKRELEAARKDPGSVSGDEMAGLELQIEESKQALKEAREDNKEAQRERETAERRGPSKSPAVVEARQQREEARRQVADARRELQKAHDAEEEALHSVGATAAAAKTALDSLPPSAQRFARFLFGLKPRLDDLRETAADGLLPGVEQGIRSALPLFPRLRAAVGGMSGVLGNAAERAGEFLGSKAFGRDFSKITAGNSALLGHMASAGMSLFSALRHVMVAAQPFLGWLGRSAERMTGWIDGAAEAGRKSGDMARFFGQTRSVMERVSSILQSVGAGFLQIGKAAAPLGREILGALDKSAQRFEEWAESFEGKNSLRKYFEDAKPGIFEMGRLAGDLVKSFVRLSGGKGFAKLTRAIRTDLLPVLEDVIERTTSAFGPHLVSLLVEVAELFGNLAGARGPLTMFVDGLRKVIGFVNTLLEKVPGLETVVVTMAGFVAVNKGLKFTAAITGVSKLVDWFKKLRTAALGAAGAEQLAATPGGGGLLGKAKGKAGGLLGKAGGALGLTARAAPAAAPLGMLGGAEVGAVLGSGGSSALAAAPAAGPWIAIGAAIAAAGAGLYLLYKHSETFRKMVDPLGDAAGDAFGEIKKQVSLLGDAFGGKDGPITAIKDFYQDFKGPIDAAAKVVKSGLLIPVKAAFHAIGGVIRGLGQIFSGQIQVIRGIVEVISGILTLRFDRAWDGVKTIFGGAIKQVIGVVRTLTAPISGTIKAVAEALKDVFGGAWEKVSDVFRDGRDAVIGFVEDIADVINKIPGIPDINVGGESGGRQFGKGGTGKWNPKTEAAPVGRYSGGPVDRPMVIVGEEAPQHPEWVIATNPQYRSNNIAYWMQAGRDLGIPGFLTGGDMWGTAKGAASSIGGAAANLVGKGAGFFLDRLPTPDLPSWMGDLGGYVIDKVGAWIKGGFDSGELGAKPASKIPAAAAGWNGKVLVGRVSWFNGPATTTASGTPVAKPGLALNLKPGTEWGWDNDITNAWMAAAGSGKPVYGRTTIAGKTANLPIIDKGPHGSTGRAIDVTEAGVHKLGLDPAAFPTDSIGKVKILARRRGGPIGFTGVGRGTIKPDFDFAALRGPAKGTASRAVSWAANNVGVTEGSARHRRWVEETGGVFDPWCSVFVGAAMKAQGLPAPANVSHSSTWLSWSGGKTVGSSLADAIPGDILVFNPDGGETDHTGIYVGGGDYISGNMSNEVIKDAVSNYGGLVGVVRPFYPGGSGEEEAGRGGAGGGAGAGGRAKPKPRYKMGLSGGSVAAVPPLKPTPLPAGAASLPPSIKDMLRMPGLTKSQQLSIADLAGSLASSTKEPTFDAQGFETSADSRADDIAAAKFQKSLVAEQKQAIEKRLREIKRKLTGEALHPKEQRRLLGLQARLMDQLGSSRTTLQSLNETIHSGPADPDNPPPTASDYANRDLALAQLTADRGDDIAAQARLVAIAEEELRLAQQTADPSDDLEAAQNLNAAAQALKDLVPTATDFANRDLALAQLTESVDDDKAAMEKLEKIFEEDLAAALQTGDPGDDTEAAQNLKGVRDSLDALNETISNVEQQRREFEQERLALDKKLVAMAEAQGPALFAALIAAIDGAIGGPLQSRGALAAPGSPAAYQ